MKAEALCRSQVLDLIKEYEAIRPVYNPEGGDKDWGGRRFDHNKAFKDLLYSDWPSFEHNGKLYCLDNIKDNAWTYDELVNG